MPLNREKYRRLPDLYVQGTEVVLKDDVVLWLQAINPLQRDEAQHDAQVARSRLVMALKSDHASDERQTVEAAYIADGREEAIRRLSDAKASVKLLDAVNAIRDDPDWAERLDIMDRSDELLARPQEDAERKLLEDINTDYLQEVTRRQQDEVEYLNGLYEGYSDERLIEEYVDFYVERRGGELAQVEFALTELWYAARVCEGVRVSDTEWDHSKCEGHDLQVYESKADVRALPEDLQNLLAERMRELNMSVREAKNSARQESSSVSSPLPSEPVESTRSTQTETPDAPLGTSQQPSRTLSRS